MREFKINDRVVIVSNQHGDNENIGKIGTICDIDYALGTYPILVEFDDHSEDCIFAARELRLEDETEDETEDVGYMHNQREVYLDGKRQMIDFLDMSGYPTFYNESEVIKKVLLTEASMAYDKACKLQDIRAEIYNELKTASATINRLAVLINRATLNDK